MREKLIMSNIQPQLNDLRRGVEAVAGRSIKLPSDCEYLSRLIQADTHERISVNTLKRLWGLMPNYETSRRFTLNVLSRYAGYNDWDDFCHNREATASSQFFESGIINAQQLAPGAVIEIKWHPERRLVAAYDGSNQFHVAEVCNCKMAAGDTFICQTFVPGQALVLDNVHHAGLSHPVSYCCGKQGGVQVRILT